MKKSIKKKYRKDEERNSQLISANGTSAVTNTLNFMSGMRGSFLTHTVDLSGVDKWMDR